MGLKQLALGILLGIMLMACAGVSFQHYALDLDHQVLVGDTAEHDLALSVCEPQTGNAYPCIVMKLEEWTRASAYMKSLEKQLKACQSQ